MKLKIKVANLDGIDASFHSLYTEQADGSFLLTGIEGMKSQEDVDKLSQALNAERGEHRKTKQTYAPLLATGLDLADIVSLVDRRDELEALAKGNSDVEALVAAKLKASTGPLERELATLKTTLAERDTQLGEYVTKERNRVIGDAIRSAATASQGFLPHAVEDALMLGASAFEVQEDGTVLTKDGYRPDVWLADLQQKRPHWWAASTGGGAGGSGGGGGGDNPYLKASWNITKQAQLHRENPEKAAQMRRAAGVELGAIAPVK